MRVLHVITNLELAGAQSSVVGICTGLRAAGLDVHLAFSSKGGRTPRSERTLVNAATAAGLAVHDVSAMRRGISPLRDVHALAALTCLIRRIRPAIVHTRASKAGVLGRLAARLAAGPIVVHTVRGWSFYAARSRVARGLAVACERWVARDTAAMIAVATALAVDGRTREIGAANRYRVIRSGIDIARFSEPRDRHAARSALGIEPAVCVIGSVMALTAAKAPLDLIEVARRVISSRPDVVFVIVGYGPLAAILEAAALRAGIEANFRFVGLRADVAAIYPAFDLLLSTSHWEGLPRVAVEAIASGVPVVATDVGGCSEVVVDGHTGYLAPSGDVDALALRVLEVLDDTSLRAKVVAASASVLVGHDLANVVEQHIELYEELTGSRLVRSAEPEARCVTC